MKRSAIKRGTKGLTTRKPLARSSGLARSPMRRSGPVDGPAKPRPRERRIIKPVSEKMAARRARERDTREAYKAAHPWCEIGAVYGEIVIQIVRGLLTRPPCTLKATDLHEPWTRAQGGPTDDPRNFAHLCRNCHDWLDTVEGRRWGVAHGFRVAKGARPGVARGRGEDGDLNRAHYR